MLSEISNSRLIGTTHSHPDGTLRIDQFMTSVEWLRPRVVSTTLVGLLIFTGVINENGENDFEPRQIISRVIQ